MYRDVVQWSKIRQSFAARPAGLIRKLSSPPSQMAGSAIRARTILAHEERPPECLSLLQQSHIFAGKIVKEKLEDFSLRQSDSRVFT
jgi:hypothetical protein